ncbi:MAG TPA: sigma-70 family RNA polymerase sigma factor, partial [Polyangiaceae bacterium]
MNTPAPGASNQKQDRAREAEEDRALIARAQAGDMVAFRRLVERHQRRAFAIALSLVRDENDARELVQDAFLRVFKNLGGFQGGSSFFTWLYRIITNLSIDLIRKPGRQTTDLEEARLEVDDGPDFDLPFISRMDGADPVDVVRRREIAARLQTALDALPSYHRAVIVMREIDGLSYEEMAQAMSVSKGTIMSRLFHA